MAIYIIHQTCYLVSLVSNVEIGFNACSIGVGGRDGGIRDQKFIKIIANLSMRFDICGIDPHND